LAALPPAAALSVDPTATASCTRKVRAASAGVQMSSRFPTTLGGWRSTGSMWTARTELQLKSWRLGGTRIMRGKLIAVGIALAFVVSAEAANKVKVGFISTLSGPSAALGVDIRDGFQLAVKMNGGKLGGLPAEVLVGDDQFKPDVGRQIATKYVQLDKVDFLTGFVFSNIMLAAVPVAFEA